jgi:predicted phage terminase large subunit-like protein
LDDPISGFEQAQSLTQLQKVHSWYETDFVTRLKPGAKTVLICQRLSPNDLAGYLIQRNAENPTKRQKILKFPMIRPDGSRLWPEWYTEEMVLDAQRDDFKWRTLYQQEPPSDTGSWVSPDEIQIVDRAPEPENSNGATLHYYILSDLALSVNSGDYTVHAVVGVTTSHDVFIVDVYRERSSPEVSAEVHLNLVEQYHPMECLIDDDNAAKVYVHLLVSRARERGVPVPWKTLPMRGQDKETRAAALRGLFKRRKIYVVRSVAEDSNGWLIREILNFPNALGDGVDDGVDALSLIGRRFALLGGPAPTPAPAKPVKYAHEATLNELWEDREHTNGLRRRL